MAAARVSAKLLERLAQAKRQSFAQLLFRAARLVNERGVARVRAKGRFDLRLAHTAILPHIDFEGQRLSSLAERTGLSKQTIGPLVADLADLGMVVIEPDPTDGRAKQVRYTKAGAEAMLDGLETLGEIEQEIEGELGARRTETLHDILIRLVDVLEKR